MKCLLGISNFLEEISSLSHSVVFLYFFALITKEVFLISLSLLFFETLQSDAYIFSFLLCFLLLFFSQLFVRPPQIAILLFCISKERWLCGCRRAERSYSTFKVIRGNLVQGKEQWLCFAGAAMKRYPMPKVRETQDKMVCVARGH